MNYPSPVIKWHSSWCFKANWFSDSVGAISVVIQTKSNYYYYVMKDFEKNTSSELRNICKGFVRKNLRIFWRLLLYQLLAKQNSSIYVNQFGTNTLQILQHRNTHVFFTLVFYKLSKTHMSSQKNVYELIWLKCLFSCKKKWRAFLVHNDNKTNLFKYRWTNKSYKNNKKLQKAFLITCLKAMLWFDFFLMTCHKYGILDGINCKVITGKYINISCIVHSNQLSNAFWMDER